MNKKKLLPLAVLAAVVVLLAVLLAVLTRQDETADTALPLCSFDTDSIDKLAYSGNNQDVSLIKGSDGNWMLDSDPALPLDQTKVESLVEDYANLSAQRKLQDSELGELPEKSDVPQMEITIGAGENSVELTVDQLNSVADIYYVYDGTGAAYTVKRSDLATLSKSARDLYQAQTLTDKTIDDVAAMQVNEFTQTDGSWTLTDDPDYALTQSAVKKMANTILQMETAWTITTPDADSAYGLDSPDVTATLTFTDGTSLTVRLGAESADGTDRDSLCYLASDAASTVVYEVNADQKAAFAVTKESLYDDTATAETATGDVVAEYPVGGKDDYADSLPE